MSSFSPPFTTPQRLGRSQGLWSKHAPRSKRGFTLIELMVTVVIIGLLATIAAPGVYQRINNYQARNAAETVAGVIRLARLRAMGRGAAVRILIDNVDATATLSVREAVQGASASDPGCDSLPEPSCSPRVWDNTDSHTVESFNYTTGGEYAAVIANGTSASTVDLCFTPLGRTLLFSGGGYAPLTQVVQVAMTPTHGGLTRDVLILPSGTSRVQARSFVTP